MSTRRFPNWSAMCFRLALTSRAANARRAGSARRGSKRSSLASRQEKPGRRSEQAEWKEIVTALKLASLCGLGTGLAEFAESILRYYAEDLRPCFA